VRKLIVFLLTLLPFSVFAQTPSADWRTVETKHFRVHYPQPFEAWAHDVVARLESTRDRVATRIGYFPEERVDVMVADPEATANGSAWPVLGWPRIILWTSPPEPESSIGSFRDWREMLVTHEQAHIIHLARPSRNPLQRLRARVLPIGPVTDAPRWVLEGYATVIEGELTGSGRPFGAMRASVLRSWGRRGRLPSYDRLASDRSSWMGMSMAYLTGSAYLEWLQQRAGQDALPKLWRRMTARQTRSFDAAFRGVFGESPAVLYSRFAAEVTAASLTEEQAMGARSEGVVWQDFDWTTDPPALSPDGSQLTTVLRSRKDPARLVVFSTAPAAEEERKFEERIEKMLERDPEDVAPVRVRPLPRKELFKLQTISGGDPRDPRFASDGKSIFFHQLEPDDEGVLHADLFRWHFADGRLDRLTERGDLREADPSPDGSRIVAVRNRHGRSAIVQLDLTTGAIVDITPAAASDPSGKDSGVSAIYARPRWSRDGKRIAVIRHEDAHWQPLILDVESGRAEMISTPGDVVAALVWSPDGLTLYTSIAEDGHFNLAAIDLNSRRTEKITHSLDPAFAPEIDSTGNSLYFLSLDADGFDISTIPAATRSSGSTTSVPIFPPNTTTKPEAVEVNPSRSYGFGRQEMLPLISTNLSRSSESLEIGLRLGDLIGRIDTVAIASVGSTGSLRGASIATAVKRFPVELSAQLYRAEQDNTRRSYQPGEAPGAALFDFEENGLELRATKRFGARARSVTVAAGTLFTDRAEGAGAERAGARCAPLRGTAACDTSVDEARAFFETSWQWNPRVKSVRLSLKADSAISAGEETTVLRAGGVVGARFGGFTLGIEGLYVEGGDGGDQSVSLGGSKSSILPLSAYYNRIVDPAYASGARFGSDGSRVGITLGLANGVRFFVREDSFSSEVCCEQPARSSGVEFRTDFGPFPLLRLPGVELQAGAARVDIGQAWERTSYWLVTTIRP